MGLSFEWDHQKEQRNLEKQRVSFIEATTVFGDPFSLTIEDPLHSIPGENRFVIIGLSITTRILIVVHCERGEKIRIISARIASKNERKTYEKKRK
ncbi:BrnT family toxin [Candidatus Riflebacteria bacterium]